MTYAEEKYENRLKYLTDSKLQVECNNIINLRPEIALLLIREAQRRNILTKSIKDYLNSRRYLSEKEIEELVEFVKGLKCSLCDLNNNEVGYSVKNAVSLIYKTSVSEEEFISCKDCAIRMINRSTNISLLGGWWSLTGIFITPYVLIKNWTELLSDFKNSENHFRVNVLENYMYYRELNV